MALPPGITPKTVTVGVASFFDGAIAEGTATVTAPVNVVHTPTNRPIFSSQISKRFVNGQASFDLCPTDAEGLNRKDFTYTLNVVISGALVQPEPIWFVLPEAGPDEIDLDSLVTVPSSAGIPISVAVLTAEDLPDYMAGVAADEDSAFSVAQRAAFGSRRHARALEVFLQPDRIVPKTLDVTLGAGSIADVATFGTDHFRLSEASVASIASPTDVGGGITGLSPSPGDVKQLGMFDFWVQAPVFAIGVLTKSDVNFLEIRIDGQLVRPAAPLGVNGDGQWWPITVANPRPMHVEVRTRNLGIVGVQVSRSVGTVWKATAPVRPTRAVFLGDSFTSGVGDPIGRSLAYDTADLLGWQCINAGVSSTGYTNAGDGNGSTTFVNRVPVVAAENPDVVVLLGSVNDWTNRAQLQTAAASCFSALATALPTVPVYVFGVQRMGGGGNAEYDAMDAALAAAAASSGPTVVGVWPTTGWVTGTGRVGTPAGDGNADTFVTADGHPTSSGHRNYGARIAAAIAGAYPSASV